MAQSFAQMFEDAEFCRAMERAAAAYARYRERLPIIPFAYTRTRLQYTPRFEIIVMRWAPGAVSPIHDHGDSRCWVQMLEGNLAIENFIRDESADGIRIRPEGACTMRAGDLDARLGPRELHRVRNVESASAYSLQLYARPIQHYCVYDEKTSEARNAMTGYDLDLDLAALLAQGDTIAAPVD